MHCQPQALSRVYQVYQEMLFHKKVEMTATKEFQAGTYTTSTRRVRESGKQVSSTGQG